MRETDSNNYFYLNRQGRWPDFKWHGLELGDDGALRLSTVPLLTGALPESVKTAPVPDGPAGLAADSVGAIYFSDPNLDRVSRVDGCDGSSASVACIGGSGTQFTTFSSPRGLSVSQRRNAIFVADSDNHRIQVFDLQTMHLVEVLGQSNRSPEPGSRHGELNQPWTLTLDSRGNVFVIDYGNQRVQEFNSIGEVNPAFWNRMNSSALLHQPSDIAIREQDGETRIFVLDDFLRRIFVFDESANPVLDSHGNPLVIGHELREPMGLAVAGDALYVGDNGCRRVLRYQLGENGGFAGEAIGYEGPVAALLLDRKGRLLVHSGGTASPVALDVRAGYGTQGVLFGGPIQVGGTKVSWHRLKALISPLSSNAHLDLFVHVTSKDNDAPLVKPHSQDPFSDPRWHSNLYSQNADVTDLYIGGRKAKYLWIGALFFGDGNSTPALRQLRAEFDYPTYERYLPAIYREQLDCDEFLERLLSLFESFNEEVEAEISSLPAFFDPNAVPQKFLSWLAGCVGLDVDENWDESKQRRIIAEFFRLSGRRGTPAGLRESLHLFAGVNAIIEEPILHAAWWSLPAKAESCCASCAAHTAAEGGEWNSTGDSILGWTTMLAAAQPQGAVVGTSSDLDQSHLINGDGFGSPLFSDVAHRFMVGLYRGEVMCKGAFGRVCSVLDDEKPAHTDYQLRIIEPRFRVGFQGRVGIDTVVAGGQRSLRLGSGQLLGEQTVLAGETTSHMGADTRLGVGTRLG